MTEYPLSTKSSKKTGSRVVSGPSSILERSACQSTLPQHVNLNEYKHILEGEKVFIELYYQGRVISTGYNEWIILMGGTLYKRLHHKVSIFLTNADSKDLASVLERTKKASSNCKIVSILWFQQCFQQKEKIPFQGFLLDPQLNKEEVRPLESEETIQLEMQDFLKNMCEDIQVQIQEFAKRQDIQYFQIINKNHQCPQQRLLPLREFDLGPNPNKKIKQKNQNHKKKIKTSQKIQNHNSQGKPYRQAKSMGDAIQHELVDSNDQKSKTQQKASKHVISESVKAQQKQSKNKRMSLQNLMTKYLDRDGSKQSKPKSVKNEQIKKPANTQENIKIQQIQNIQKKNQTVLNSKKSSKTVQMMFESFSKERTQKSAVSSIGCRYKHMLNERLQIERVTKRFQSLQIQSLRQAIKKCPINTLLMIGCSKTIQAKICKVNQLANSHSAITVYSIPFGLYRQYLMTKPPPHQVYFLIDKFKIIERAYYFYISLFSQLKPIIVSSRIIEQIKSYNQQIKEAHLRTPRKLQKNQLRFLRQQQRLIVKPQLIKGKRVAILNSQLPVDMQKQIITSLGAVFVTKQQYLVGTQSDLVVTNRYGLKQKNTESLMEYDLWHKVFQIQDDF